MGTADWAETGAVRSAWEAGAGAGAWTALALPLPCRFLGYKGGGASSRVTKSLAFGEQCSD